MSKREGFSTAITMASHASLCTICGEASQYTCGRCRKEFYCSGECQRHAWTDEGHGIFCTGAPAERRQNREPVNVGDFFATQDDEWVYEVVRVDGSPGDETRIYAAENQSNTTKAKEHVLTNVSYEDGAWYGEMAGKERIDLTHFRYSERMWWERVVATSPGKGVVPLGSVRNLDGMPSTKVAEILQTMQPGDHYEWMGFHFKFFDFALKDHRWHKGYLAGLRRGVLADTCMGRISMDTYYGALAKTRHVMTISIAGTDYIEKDTAEALVGLLMSEPIDDNTVRYSVFCAQELDVYDDTIAFVTKQQFKNFDPQFESMLQAMMGLYHKSDGRDKVTLKPTASMYPPAYYEYRGYTKNEDETYSMNFDSEELDSLWMRSKKRIPELRTFVKSVPKDKSYRRRMVLY